MFHKLGFMFSVVAIIFTLHSCSSGGDTVATPERDTTKRDTTKIDTTKHSVGNLSNVSVNIVWTVGEPMMILLTLDSAGHSLSVLPGDTVWYMANGSRFGVRRNTANWMDVLQEVVDSGAYEFHFQRHVAADTVSATFTLPVIPFHISAPRPGSHVSIGGHINDTIVYEPAGGKELWLLYLDRNERPSEWFENSYPDNGRYVFIKDGARDGYVKLLRHFVGNLSSTAPFKAVHYDYWESSQPLALSF